MVKIILNASLTMVVLIICCNSKNKLPGAIKTFSVITNYDFVMLENGQFINIQDSFKVSYYQNFILYQFPRIYEVSIPIIKGDSIYEKVISSRIGYDCFIYKNNDSVGHRLDSLDADNSRLFSVDSFLVKKANAKFAFYNKTNDSLIESKTNEEGNELVEKYIPRIKYDETYPDSTSLYFRNDKVKYPDFSFSRYLDSLKKKKLFKIIFTYNPIPKGVYSFDVPRRNIIFEMKQIQLTNEKELIKFFDRVKKIYD